MAKTVSIVDNANGKFTITDSDGQTRIVDQSKALQESAASGIKIIKIPTSAVAGTTPNTATGYQLPAGANYPGTGEKTVLINGRPTVVSEAVSQAYGAKNLGLIRSNLIKYGQLTKAEARDPNNLLSKWATIVYGAANDPDPNNRDPFKYAAALQKAGFISTATGTGAQYEPYGQQVIYDPTKAASFITEQFKALLNREPTAEEINTWSSKLKKAQEAASASTKVTYKMINGVRTAVQTGGLDEAQWLKDTIQKDKALGSEYSKVKTQAPDVTELQKDKKVYDDLIKAAKGDLEKINQAKQNTSYGRTLAEYEAQIVDQIRTSGATNDPGSANQIAKYLLDKGLSLDSESAQSYIDSQLQFGKGKVTTTGAEGKPVTTETYTGKAGSNVEKLNQVALANGLDLNQVFDATTLSDVLSAVNAGEDIGTYSKIIRDAAKVAWNVPDNVAKLMDQGVSLDSIYGTYKRAYADTLELDPNTVTLKDLAAMGVIGQPSKDSQAPQNLYDFTRQLRKDDRWQYTQQANQEVAAATQKILQDFGFMG